VTNTVFVTIISSYRLQIVMKKLYSCKRVKFKLLV